MHTDIKTENKTKITETTKVTVISPCYERFEKYEEVLQSWLNQSEVDEIIVLDNSGTFQTKLPVTVVNLSRNLGPEAKYALALWAKNQLVIFADDDIIVQPGLVRDFLYYWKEKKGGSALGILGRIFNRESYYTSSHRWADAISSPVKVDYLGGGCTLVDQSWCAVPIRECPGHGIDDLWWNYYIKDNIDFFVIPTNKYKFISEYLHTGLHVEEETRNLREQYSKEWGFL